MSLVSLPFEARAQVSRAGKPVQFGIAAGAAIPASTLSDIANTGFNGTVTLGFSPAMIPLGIRVDGAYNHFGRKSGGDVHVTSVTSNLVYKVSGATVSPYAIGGAGWYRALLGSSFGFASGSRNHFGWNIGGGISIPLSGFDTFVEARYNRIQGDGGTANFTPITFGIMF